MVAAAGCYPTAAALALAEHHGASGRDLVDAVVLGVSPDSLESHRKFKKKYQLAGSDVPALHAAFTVIPGQQ